VSAELLIGDRAFRDATRTRLEAAKPSFGQHLAEPADAGAHPIVLALITNAAATGSLGDRLPSFTKVFLRRNAQRLERMGFAVHLDEIPNAPPQVSTTAPRPARRRRRVSVAAAKSRPAR
jgi:uncharacterized protein (TIGR04141 family)